MLPVAGIAGTSLLTGCGGGGDSTPAASTGPTAATFVSASFTTMYAPTTTADRARAYSAATLDVTLSNGSVQSFDLGYEPFFLTGTQVPNGNGGTTLAGGYYDINNNPIIDNSVPASPRQFFSDSPDGTSLLTVPNANVPGVTGKPVFAVVQFEYTTWAQDGTTDMYGKLPSPIAILTLDQNPATV